MYKGSSLVSINFAKYLARGFPQRSVREMDAHCTASASSDHMGRGTLTVLYNHSLSITLKLDRNLLHYSFIMLDSSQHFIWNIKKSSNVLPCTQQQPLMLLETHLNFFRVISNVEPEL